MKKLIQNNSQEINVKNENKNTNYFFGKYNIPINNKDNISCEYESQRDLIIVDDRIYDEGMKSIIDLLNDSENFTIAKQLEELFEQKILTIYGASIIASYIEEDFKNTNDIFDVILALYKQHYKGDYKEVIQLAKTQLNNQLYVITYISKYFKWTIDNGYISMYRYENMEVS